MVINRHGSKPKILSNPMISASILSADFANLAEQIKRIEETSAEYIHFDVMDGVFVPAITFGSKLIQDLRPFSKKIFDVHLMITNPDSYIQEFVDAGADIITIHAEATAHLDRTIERIKSFGVRAGVAINPATSPLVIEYILDKLDLVLVMTVNPGFGGQNFIEAQLKKIETIKNMISARNLDTLISVDGGVNQYTAKKIIEAGADILVSGSYLFSGESISARVQNLKTSTSL